MFDEGLIDRISGYADARMRFVNILCLIGVLHRLDMEYLSSLSLIDE